MGFVVKCEFCIPNSRQERTKHICIQSELNSIFHRAYRMWCTHILHNYCYPIESEQTSQKADGNSHPSSSQFTSRRPRKSKRPSHGQKKKEVNKVTHSFFFSILAVSWSLLLFFKVCTKWHSSCKWNWTGSILFIRNFSSWNHELNLQEFNAPLHPRH